MKKVLLGIFVLSTLALATEKASPYLNLRIGTDFGAEYSPVTTHDDVNPFALGSDTRDLGYEIAAEILYPSSERLDIGAGIAFQNHKERESIYNIRGRNYQGLDYKSVPLYFTAQYKLLENSRFNPYFKFNFGYSFSIDEKSIEREKTSSIGEVDVNNGLYYAAGIGMMYDNFTVDLMYGVNKANATIRNTNITLYNLDVDADYERWTLSFGYRFNLK